MTMNNNNNVPSTEGVTFSTTSLNVGVTLPAHQPQRTIRSPLISKSLPRKPVRRALTELGRNDRKHNARLANRLLTISTEEFKQKWNFDPIKMKPINTEGNAAGGGLAVVGGDGTPNKYQWELVKQNKAQEQNLKDKKELERTMFSLVSSIHTDRKQTRLSTVAVELSSSPNDDMSLGQSSTEDESSSRIPRVKEEESTVSSTTEEGTNATATQAITGTRTASSSEQQQQQQESITVTSSEQQKKEEEIRERLAAADRPTAAAAAVPTVTSAALTNNNNITVSSRQSKITDFASHRKIVHGPALKEESDLQPPSKRPRLTC